MKNLELLNVKRCKIGDETQEIAVITINESTAYMIEDNFLFSLSLETGHKKLLSEDKFNCITPLVFLDFQNQLWFGTGEEFVFYSPEKQQLNVVPMMTQFEAAVWNPTEEVVAVVFSDGKVGVYAFDLECYTIYCVEETSLEAAIPQSVYVGWGSEKTQFRGSEGKLKKTSKSDDTYDKPSTDKTPKISWRGNGEMFVVNYWQENHRTFKVFEYPCKPAYRIEETKGLQAPTAWRPTGNMIACPVCTNDKHTMVIFEKNGCKRFGFDLTDPSEVKEIVWSPNGKVLALNQKTNGSDTIDLYTTSNYKWYLKQSLKFTPENPLISFDFVNTTNDLILMRVFTQNSVIEYLFRFVVHKSVCNYENTTTCAVIDGKKLLLTVFGRENCPPPMSNSTIELQNPINFVAFNSNRSLLGVIDADYNIVLYNYTTNTIIKSCKIQTTKSGGRIPLQLHHFYWCDTELRYLKSPEKSTGNYEHHSLENTQTNTFNDDLCEITVSPPNTEIYIYKNKLCVKNTHEDFEVNLPNIPIKASGVQVENSTYVFVLTQNNKFFVNDKLLANQVTSFVIHDDKYLLVTTSDNKLYCIRLIGKQIEDFYRNNFNEHFYWRSIEQSATLVCAITNTSEVVLQMPRGNTEIVSCRLIAIDLLERMLQKNAWEEALYFIRTQRLNVNLLIDLDPHRFMVNIPKLVAAAKTPSVLNALVQEIIDDNTLEMNYPKCAPESVRKLQNKRQQTCGAILDYLEQHNYVDYISSIVMICIHHFSIERGLIYMQDLLKNGENPDGNLEEAAKAAMQIFKTYVNEDVLYKKALLLYDVNLAWFIARNCQMDPCEYEPFLLKLKAMSDVKRRFEINTLMEKPEVAIKYLVRTPDVDDKTVLEFAHKYSVGHVIYDCVPTDTPIFTELSKMYAKKLHSQKNYNESATIYARSDLWQDAFKEYILALNWKRAMYAMNKLNLPVSERKKHVENLTEGLIKAGKIVEAGQVYEDCLSDWESSLRVLIQNGYFTDAVRVAQKYSMGGDKEIEINDAIKNHGRNLLREIKEMEETFHKYYNRIRVVRKAKIARYTNEVFSPDANAPGGRLEHSDIYSDTESTSSRSTGTRKTSTSVRNLRRRQAKIENLKEGGVYEDIALLRALHILSAKVCGFGGSIEEFCLVCLEQQDLYDDVKCLHDSLVGLQKIVKATSCEIWPKFFGDVELKGDANIEEVALYENVPLLDDQYRRPPKEIDDPIWRLTIFE